ncbi:MAG: hypothetical protein CMN30_30835 [Sandaracinus sp.]|nr:hypothetical protein [Sandaracinus sp.]
MTDAAPEAPRSERRARLGRFLLGLPAALLLVLPWDDHGWTPTWELATDTAIPLLVLGGAGVLMVAAAFVGTSARRALTVVAGTAACLAGIHVLGHLGIRGGDLERLGLFATRTWLALITVAAGAEMAMHRRPRSRTLTIFAALAWATLLVAWFTLPTGPFGESEEIPALGLREMLDGSYYRYGFATLCCTWWAGWALVGLLQQLRRVGSDRELAAGRRFRTGWLAWMLVVVPLTLGFTLSMVMVGERNADMVPNVLLSFGAFLLAHLGGALALRELLTMERGDPRVQLPRAGFAYVAAAVALGIGGVLFFAWGRGASIRDLPVFAEEVGSAVTSAVRGEPFDRRFLGGYSDADLRAAGAVELPPDATVALVGFAVSEPADAWVVVRPGHAPEWLARTDGEAGWSFRADTDTLERADPALAGIVRTLAAGSCLPGYTDDAALVQGIAARLGSEVCGDDPSSRERRRAPTLGRPVPAGRAGHYGAIDRWAVVYTHAGGAPITLTGALHAETGRAWIGNPEVAEP